MTEDLTGAALWLDVDVTAAADEDTAGSRQLFVDGLGAEYAKRFFILDELLSANHPGHESHAYLLFAGVAALGEPVNLPDGPTLYPMWRRPTTALVAETRTF